MSSEVKRILDELGSPDVLVVGDFMADVYVWSTTLGTSADAPVLLVEEDSREVKRGGGALVAENLRALGAKVRALGVVGEDETGEKLTQGLSALGVDTRALLKAPDRGTPTRTWYMASLDVARRAAQDVLCVVKRNPSVPRRSIMEELVGRLEDELSEVDLAVCVDYGLSRATRVLLPELVKAAKSRGTKLILDPKDVTDLAPFSGADVLVLNRRQAEEASGIEVRLEEDMRVAGERVAQRLSTKSVVITVGRDGMFLYRGPSECKLFRTEAAQVSDLMGAEEAGLAALAMVIGGGGSYDDAVTLANAAAGVAIQQFGAQAVGKKEISAKAEGINSEGKIVSKEEMVRKAEECRRLGRKVVFTNGCFDILHFGHVKYLEHAKAQGDCLMVGVNSDESVRKLKGADRPIMPEAQRTGLVAGLESVDYVAVFGEDTPLELIKTVKPDVLVKGEDWREGGVVGKEYVEGYGGRVVLAPVVKDVSTTIIVKRIKREEG